MSQSGIPVCPYQPLSGDYKKLLFEEWETFVKETCPQQHGVAWIMKDSYPRGARRDVKFQPETSENDALNGPPLKRCRGASGMVWRVTYECHRSGKPEIKNRPKGGKSGKELPLQKASKKIGCQARLRADYYGDDSDHVHLTFSNEHNHPIGNGEELRHLPISKDVRNDVEERLREGYNPRDVRRVFEERLGCVDPATNTANPVVHRDQLLPESWFYNVWRQSQLNAAQKSPDEGDSVSHPSKTTR